MQDICQKLKINFYRIVNNLLVILFLIMFVSCNDDTQAVHSDSILLITDIINPGARALLAENSSGFSAVRKFDIKIIYTPDVAGFISSHKIEGNAVALLKPCYIRPLASKGLIYLPERKSEDDCSEPVCFYNGKQAAIPWLYTPVLIFYRPGYLKKYGIELTPDTMENLRNMMNALTDEAGPGGCTFSGSKDQLMAFLFWLDNENDINFFKNGNYISPGSPDFRKKGLALLKNATAFLKNSRISWPLKAREYLLKGKTGVYIGTPETTISDHKKNDGSILAAALPYKSVYPAVSGYFLTVVSEMNSSAVKDFIDFFTSAEFTGRFYNRYPEYGFPCNPDISYEFRNEGNLLSDIYRNIGTRVNFSYMTGNSYLTFNTLIKNLKEIQKNNKNIISCINDMADKIKYCIRPKY